MDGLSGGWLNRKNVTDSKHLLRITNGVATFLKRACKLQVASEHKQRPKPGFFCQTKPMKTHTATAAFVWIVAPTAKGDRGWTGVHRQSTPPSLPDGTDTDSKVQNFSQI